MRTRLRLRQVPRPQARHETGTPTALEDHDMTADKHKHARARLAVALALALAPLAAPAAPAKATVYQSPSCGCCTSWATHLKKQGFKVTTRMMSDVTPAKDRTRVPVSLRSCHTAEVGGYVIEGHVPAQTVTRLLKERPRARGLSVPGMPQSAPGMDGPYEPYNVILFSDRTQWMYEKH
jgi:hypothetical protein